MSSERRDAATPAAVPYARMTRFGVFLTAYAQTLGPAALERAHSYVYAECNAPGFSRAKWVALQALLAEEFQSTMRACCAQVHDDVVAAVDLARNRLYCLQNAFSCTRRCAAQLGLPLEALWVHQQGLPCFREAASLVSLRMEHMSTVSAARAGHVFLTWARIAASSHVAPLTCAPALSAEQLRVLRQLATDLPVFGELGRRWQGRVGISRLVVASLGIDDLLRVFALPNTAARKRRDAGRSASEPERKRARTM